jgi:hypothetical protein
VAIEIRNVLIHDAQKQRRTATHTLAFACLLGATLCILAALPEWDGWTTPLLLLVPGFLIIVVMRFSIISAGYLALVTVNFGVTSLILGSHWQPGLVSAVLTWSIAITAATLLIGPSSSQRAAVASKSWPEPSWSHYALSGGLIGVSLFLALSHSSGYAAQIATGTSTPTGILGTPSTAAPIITLTLLLNCIRSDRPSRGAIGLAGAQIAALALSGFRGAVGVFIISILVGAALTLPRDSAWRRPSRLVITLPLLLFLTLSGFILAANIKNTAAADLGVTSSGTQLFTSDNAITNTATRMQLASPLNTALKYRDDAAARDAVSWTTQVEAVVPRFLWPEKPTVDYGQRVSVVMYGLVSGHSSSTVTTIGDCLLNFGRIGLLLIGLLVGYAFRWVSARIDAGARGLVILVSVVVIYSSLNQEQPIALIIVGIIRNIVLVGGLWAVASLVANREIFHVRTRWPTDPHVQSR